MAEKSGFDPGRYLTKVGSADYLEVKWRLVWLREVHPEAQISTELVSHDVQGRHAIFRANVSIPGAGSASGYGSEDYGGFREYIEKAETKAVGRALAALGFGTQFCNDFDFAEGQERVVDAPVNRQNAPQRAQGNGHNVVPPQQNGQPMIQNPSAPASDKQINFIRSLAKDCGMTVQHPDGSMHTDDAALAAIVGVDYGEDWPRITKGTASALIEQLQKERDKPRKAAMGATAQPAMFAANDPSRYTQ